MPPAASPAPVVVKKGLPPLAWVGIGCGGLILIGIILMLVAGVFISKKAKELGVDFSKNPEKAAAELIVSMTPDLEKVSSDDVAGTITIRMKDGIEKTLTYKDIQEGKFATDQATPMPEPGDVPADE